MGQDGPEGDGGSRRDAGSEDQSEGVQRRVHARTQHRARFTGQQRQRQKRGQGAVDRQRAPAEHMTVVVDAHAEIDERTIEDTADVDTLKAGGFIAPDRRAVLFEGADPNLTRAM